MKYFLIAVLVIIALIILAAIFVVSSYNNLIKQRNSVEEAFATMDVYLKKRWDLIPNIVASVKGYAKHEAQTLENVIAARNSRYQDLSDDEKIAVNYELSEGLSGISVVAEQYPDLKANQNFLDLNAQLESTENDIANSRKYYNAVVKNYNNRVQMFPSSIIASLFKFEKKQMFIVENDAEKQAVKVEF